MKVFEILKSRWSEAVMVVGIQACFVALSKDIQTIPQTQTSADRMILMLVGVVIFGLLSQLFLWGFLRTVAVECVQPVEPMTLLQVGRTFFWRMMLFQCLLAPIFWILTLVPLRVISGMAYGGELDKIPMWIIVVISTMAELILIKPTYFIPALILQRNCSLIDALRSMGKVRLQEMRSFVALTVFILLIGGAAEFFSGLVVHGDMLYYPVLVLFSLVASAGSIAILLMAVDELLRRMPTDEVKSQI